MIWSAVISGTCLPQPWVGARSLQPDFTRGIYQKGQELFLGWGAQIYTQSWAAGVRWSRVLMSFSAPFNNHPV